jgi:hypothetical protein
MADETVHIDDVTRRTKPESDQTSQINTPPQYAKAQDDL